MAMLDVKNISKSFGATRVLEDISFSLEQGETVAVIGASGSGKTTLLRCLTYLEKADKGTVAINGQTVFDAASQHKLTDSELRDRRLHFGMVFQSFNLFPQYTALENVMLAGQLLAKERPDYKSRKKEINQEVEDKAKELLGQAGFSNVKTEEVESLKPKGEVIHQSAAKNAEIDVNTEIVLQISKGPEETTGPTQATTPKDPNEPVTIGVQFSLPERDEPYILSIFLNGKEVIESREIVPGTSSFVCDLTGTGTQTYDIYIDGEYYQSKEVPFN